MNEGIKVCNSANLDISNKNATFVIPDIRTSELKKLLKSKGCYFVCHGGRHDKWFSPITGNKFMVPRHDAHEVPSGTFEAIMKQAGIYY